MRARTRTIIFFYLALAALRTYISAYFKELSFSFIKTTLPIKLYRVETLILMRILGLAVMREPLCILERVKTIKNS